MESSASSRSGEHHAGGAVLVEAWLQGGAPWGFTLQGGLEHGEPLIISKVEEGGKVCSLQHPLLVGDRLLLINQLELSGSRQEAVSLVKGSHRTLQLTVCRDSVLLSSLEDSDSLPASQLVVPPVWHADKAPSGGVPLNSDNRRSEPTSRPHSWHSTKLGAGGPNSSQPEQLSQGGMDSLHTPWHQGYPHHHQASVSTADLCVGWDSEFSYLRRSPDQYSSRESLDSLDPPPLSQSRAEPLHTPLDPHDHRDHQQTPTHSSTRSSNSMDLLHNKRDSAYSSFSTSSSIPEYLASAPSLSSERCCSLESVPQRGRGGDGCYSLESVSQGGREGECPHSHVGFMRSELTLAASLGNSLTQERGVSKPGSGDGEIYHGNSSTGTTGGVHGSKRHSVGPIWGLTVGPGSSDGLKETPALPNSSDSYPVTRAHERPNSWSSLDHARHLRPLHKGSWHHSSGSVATAKGSYAADVQLHTVVEKSPESSPTTRPRQGGGPSSGVPNANAVPPGSHRPPYSQAPPIQGQPALGARDPQLQPDMGAWNGEEAEEVKGRRDGGEVEEVKMFQNGENAYQNSLSSVIQPQWSTSTSSSSPTSSSFSPPRENPLEADRVETHQHQVLPRVAQGQVGPARTPQTPSYPPTTTSQPQPIPQASQPWSLAQQEHPLTRLEMALAEVQRCASPNHVPPTGGRPANSGGSQGSSPTLSVLEKVNRFERRQHSVRQRSLSNHSYSLQGKLDQSGRSSPCGAEDLRNMLERSGAKAHRTMSYRGRSSEHAEHRNPADPTSVLLRSCSTFHLKDPRPEETPQPLLCPDHSFSSSYRDSLKDAQSKVLGSTSFRRRDLSSSLKAPPPALLQQRSTSSSPGLPISSSSSSSIFGQLSLERKGPKTKPKPQQMVLTSSCYSSAAAPPPVPSPHTPRERHTVGPPPVPPCIPTLGPPLVGRVCGRKRLSVQQKKRSLSEPDSMHEVGVSDPETSALFRRGAGESSVADRRRMFEGAVHNSIKGGDGPRPQIPGARPQSAGPHPQGLRQAQQDALAQYIHRKRTEKRDQERPQRPHSYLQPNSDRRTVVSSLYSATSLLSLRESCPDWTLLPGEGWPSSPQPPGAQSSVSNPRPPSSGTEPAPRPPLQPGAPGPARQPRGPSPDQGLSRIIHGALQRVRLSVSASAEDLLEGRETGDQQLHRCLSTPPGITSHHQGVGELCMTILPTTEARQQPDRPMNTQSPEGCAPSSDPAHQHDHLDVRPCCSASAAPQAGASESRPPVTRRERPHVSSPLAASVGLPCPSLPRQPASPSPLPDPSPVTSPQKSLNPDGEGLAWETMATAGTEDDGDRANSFHLPPPPSPAYAQSRLSSLRISESGLLSLSQPLDMCQPGEDLDEVFLPFPHSSTTESDLSKHFPPPPPSPPQQEVVEGTGIHGDHPFTMPTAASIVQPSHPVPCFAPGGLISPGTQDSLELKYQPLPRREASAQELKVQILLGQLVLRDRSLAPLMDTLWSKRTIELMDEVFHGLALDDTSPWQRRDSTIGEKQRVQDDGSPGGVGGLEIDLEDQEKDLNVTKGELCDALRRHVEELQQEKEILQEELRQHRALGASLEAVVQDRCRPNERDKYRVFIGDLEKVVNLLLSLSGRLARTEAALHYLELRQEDCTGERASLLLKRSALRSQREDALELKENLERRQRIVHSLLIGHMTHGQLVLYRQLVSTKPSLLIHQRHLDDLIRQGKEHLVLMIETLHPPLAEETDTSRGYPLSTSPAPYPSPATPQLPTHTARGTAVTSL